MTLQRLREIWQRSCRRLSEEYDVPEHLVDTVMRCVMVLYVAAALGTVLFFVALAFGHRQLLFLLPWAFLLGLYVNGKMVRK